VAKAVTQWTQSNCMSVAKTHIRSNIFNPFREVTPATTWQRLQGLSQPHCNTSFGKEPQKCYVVLREEVEQGEAATFGNK
jgi:hypothetical protein